jgi:hypothetical protein
LAKTARQLVVHDEVLRRVEGVLVDADHECRVGILGWGGDDHPMRARLDVRRCLLPAGEPARALDHDVDAQLPPRQLGGVGLHEHDHGGGADHHRVVLDGHGHREVSVDRVPGQQSGERLGIAEVVYRRHLDVMGRLDRGPEESTPGPAEPVDCDSHCHPFLHYSTGTTRSLSIRWSHRHRVRSSAKGPRSGPLGAHL